MIILRYNYILRIIHYNILVIITKIARISSSVRNPHHPWLISISFVEILKEKESIHEFKMNWYIFFLYFQLLEAILDIFSTESELLQGLKRERIPPSFTAYLNFKI
jgi:hypothetical protein